MFQPTLTQVLYLNFESQAKEPTLYFGLHFANDPGWSEGKAEEMSAPKSARSSRRPAHACLYNFMINDDLLCITTKAICRGDELFLDYEYFNE